MNEDTDKFAHGYYPLYERLAGKIGSAGKVLEVGVLAGESLRMWQRLMPEALVVGVDCNPHAIWPPGTHKILASQISSRMAAEAEAFSPIGYDLIVDDASHDGPFSAETFKLLWPLIVPGGWYVLEDWTVGYMEPLVKTYGPSMLRFAESFLRMLKHADDPERDIDHLEYYYGQAVIQKAHA